MYLQKYAPFFPLSTFSKPIISPPSSLFSFEYFFPCQNVQTNATSSERFSYSISFHTRAALSLLDTLRLSEINGKEQKSSNLLLFLSNIGTGVSLLNIRLLFEVLKYSQLSQDSFVNDNIKCDGVAIRRREHFRPEVPTRLECPISSGEYQRHLDRSRQSIFSIVCGI